MRCSWTVRDSFAVHVLLLTLRVCRLVVGACSLNYSGSENQIMKSNWTHRSWGGSNNCNICLIIRVENRNRNRGNGRSCGTRGRKIGGTLGRRKSRNDGSFGRSAGRGESRRAGGFH